MEICWEIFDTGTQRMIISIISVIGHILIFFLVQPADYVCVYFNIADITYYKL